VVTLNYSKMFSGIMSTVYISGLSRLRKGLNPFGLKSPRGEIRLALCMLCAFMLCLLSVLVTVNNSVKILRLRFSVFSV